MTLPDRAEPDRYFAREERIADKWRDKCRAMEAERDQAYTERAVLVGEVERLREALREILSDPDARRGSLYGCLTLHEARSIARHALEPAFDDKCERCGAALIGPHEGDKWCPRCEPASRLAFDEKGPTY